MTDLFPVHGCAESPPPSLPADRPACRGGAPSPPAKSAVGWIFRDGTLQSDVSKVEGGKGRCRASVVISISRGTRGRSGSFQAGPWPGVVEDKIIDPFQQAAGTDLHQPAARCLPHQVKLPLVHGTDAAAAVRGTIDFKLAGHDRFSLPRRSPVDGAPGDPPGKKGPRDYEERQQLEQGKKTRSPLRLRRKEDLLPGLFQDCRCRGEGHEEIVRRKKMQGWAAPEGKKCLCSHVQQPLRDLFIPFFSGGVNAEGRKRRGSSPRKRSVPGPCAPRGRTEGGLCEHGSC